MAWKHLERCILLEFVEVQHFIERRVATEEGGLEALREAYRERQERRGLCRSCRRPADDGSKSCAIHRAMNAARAMASLAKRVKPDDECRSCTKQAVPGRRKCVACLAKDAARVRRRAA